MECGQLSPDGPTPAEEEKDDQMAAVDEEKGCQMVACELEAAEALAGLARCSAVRGGSLGSGELERQLVPEGAVTPTRHSQGKQESRYSEMLAQRNKDKEIDTTVSNIKSGLGKTDERIVKNIPSQLCSTSCKSNSNSSSASKFIRPKLTEAEKEARKLRRVLANRESARQTIRRRQAMYLKLTRKAADVTKENKDLKKKKELAVEQYNSLKDRNEFLNAQLAKFKKTEPREMQQEPKKSHADKSCSATMTTPIFLHNQPSTVPCFFPSFIPSLDVAQIQYPSPSNIPRRNIISCSHQVQENTLGITTPGTPLFVVPVPWLFSFLTDSSTLHAHSATNDRQNICSCSDTSLHENNNHLPSNQSMRAEASSSKKTMSMVSDKVSSHASPRDSGRPTRNCQVGGVCDVNVVSASEKTRHGLSEKKHEPIVRPYKSSKDAFAASEARRRRKELMKLKDIHCHRVHPQY